MGLIRCDDTEFINDLLDQDIREPNHENATLMVDIGRGLVSFRFFSKLGFIKLHWLNKTERVAFE